MPDFYTIANRLPTVKAPIVWFDVSRDQTVMDDLNYLLNNNPKMIIFADHGESVIAEHESAFNGKGYEGHRAMYNWLLDCRDNPDSNYEVKRVYEIQNYKVYAMVKK